MTGRAELSPPADRAALRDHIAEAFARYDWNVAPVFRSVTPNADHYGLADAVLAVLPEPASRAPVLLWAADFAESLRQFEPAFGARKSAQVSENVGILRVADALRRTAAEEQPAAADDTVHTCPGRWGGPGCTCFDNATTEPAVGEQRETQETPAAPPVGYSDGRGYRNTYCLRCPRPDSVTIPLSVNAINPQECCRACGRCLIDVARAQEEEPLTGKWHGGGMGTPRAAQAEAAIARIRQMVDAWEQQLPGTIRTTTAVEAIRGALPAVGEQQP